ncbi:type II toxin-antitoxin system RelE/ParE family toxin [Thalassolituus oleivorans]|jgi:hypothetical protein|uniref:Type II toxin-antitoxin system RelE/ParE family toxin n=1 Tax=Thalassolituus oleivorans MIL-1 TaxID=1298593 RepID=M5DRH3_9GAMM|nr:type II toxin-antitoxin system RelE/ParE family toxin [Thalassolituus oleivorans]CCU71767.1 hypothetical protein TOL_1342 [Thalassolituus oleivorans MIL-1]
MRIFKTSHFSKWANKEGLSDETLLLAVSEIESGLVDADLGGNVYKKRVATNNRGKSGGSRTLLAYKAGNKAFFVYGFAKNARSNVTQIELKALKALAKELLIYSNKELVNAITYGEIVEVLQND